MTELPFAKYDGPPVYFYAVVRKEMTGGALLAQFGHAMIGASQMFASRPGPIHDAVAHLQERLVILAATKDQLAETLRRLDAAHLDHYKCTEDEGPLKGVLTAIAFATADRDSVKPIVGELRPWREPKPEADPMSPARYERLLSALEAQFVSKVPAE